MERDYQLLKDVLSVPTHTYQEELMVQFIADWLKENKDFMDLSRLSQKYP